jgi:NAD(P)-dependent dehydrogenase (short-subunit alcohol dehydrogenase family)
MDLKLENRLALVSGSTAGIGYATAEALLREGERRKRWWDRTPT